MATGEDVAGKAISNIITALSPLLADAAIRADDKMRLLGTYIATDSSVNEKTRKKLVETAGLADKDDAALGNIKAFSGGAGKAKAAKGKKKKGTDGGGGGDGILW